MHDGGVVKGDVSSELDIEPRSRDPRPNMLY